MKKSDFLAENNPLGPAVQRYFCQYLIGQRDVSPQTVNAYRDTFKLLIHFLEQRYRKKADEMSVIDLSAPYILAFLDDLERRRGNSARSRNARLAEYARLSATRHRSNRCYCPMHNVSWQFRQSDSTIVTWGT